MLFIVLGSEGIEQASLFSIFNSKYALAMIAYVVNFNRL